MLKLEKSKNKKRLCCRLKVSTICINLQKMETLCQHSPLNKDTNIQGALRRSLSATFLPRYTAPYIENLYLKERLLLLVEVLNRVQKWPLRPKMHLEKCGLMQVL